MSEKRNSYIYDSKKYILFSVVFRYSNLESRGEPFMLAISPAFWKKSKPQNNFFGGKKILVHLPSILIFLPLLGSAAFGDETGHLVHTDLPKWNKKSGFSKRLGLERFSKFLFSWHTKKKLSWMLTSTYLWFQKRRRLWRCRSWTFRGRSPIFFLFPI